MRDKARSFRIALPLALVALAACEDASGPGSLEMLDSRAALADYGAMDAVRASAGWQGFRMVAPRMAAAGFGVEPGAITSDAIPLISGANRGRTFVYDATRHDWVIDPERTGAPANGVRFITYEPKGAEPDPTQPIGHADLIDLGDTSAGVALRLVVVERNLTIVDYTTTLEGSDGSGRITVAGYIQNADDRLDFDIDANGRKSGGVERADIDFELGIADRDFRVTGEVGIEKQHGEEIGSVDVRVRHGARSFDVDVVNERGTLGGIIGLNDSPFATVSGPENRPVFRKPDGSDITGADALVLWRIADISEDVFDLFEDLIDPIDELVIWAAIL